ncbi:zinc finger CCHC domain-containing protein 8 [Chanos chanos]|uniref:Zinc finger CCHC domain-containing protein 8 n=1 Tax=Chanos chanos TaxID=29144 RepID=A0A6J2VM27_CHACN|nr:zinc finger CCHC domain-containing protein 8 [Chanos chanos]
MADVDFGDSELFEQFEDNRPVPVHTHFSDAEDDPGELSELREKLAEYEDTIDRLKTENQELRRKLNVLSRPPGVLIENAKIDGPLLQILFGNNSISKQCHQEIEDFIFSLVQRHQQQRSNEREGSATNASPQCSSFVMEERYKVDTSATSVTLKKIKDAFSVVGSVLYFTSFCLDKLGQPLLNDNPQLTDGWEVPKYQQVFGQVIALEGEEIQIKEKRPRPCCFNCGAEDHQLRDCPKPKDMARISEKRKEFSQGNNQSNQRYHEEEVEERFAKFKPGRVSEELLDALGVSENTLPPFIYRMRELGYPPGWLKEAEMENSGLTLYDGKTSSDGEENSSHGQKVSYDVSKLVDFPGFNVTAPSGVKDEYRMFGSIPMQHHHMKHNFAAYLSSAYPTPGSNCNKRRHGSESSPHQTKKRRSNPESSRGSDMDVDTDQESPARPWSSDGFQFQPPLPIGSPSFGTPPPLPPGTPPVTPTPPPLPKGTPPPTPPANGSLLVQSEGEMGVGSEEDGLTLEELEEQQRLIWAALESTDIATNSDSETGAMETPVPSSPSVTTTAQLDAEIEEGEEDGEVRTEETTSRNGEELSAVSSPAEVLMMEVGEDQSKNESDTDSLPKHSHGDQSKVESFGYEEFIVLDESGDEDSGKEKDVSSQAVSEEGNTPQTSAQDAPPSEKPDDGEEEEPVASKITSVPHRSKFAEGIIPFEDTPEFTEVAEATGVYLRIRDLLKGSPRNQAKNKK